MVEGMSPRPEQSETMTIQTSNPMMPQAAEVRDELTQREVLELGLYGWLLGRLGRRGPTLARKIKLAHHDPRRLFTSKQRAEIVERDGCDCAYCGREVTGEEGDRIFIDHVIPHTSGGATVVENGVVACSTCNSSKGARVW